MSSAFCQPNAADQRHRERREQELPERTRSGAGAEGQRAPLRWHQLAEGGEHEGELADAQAYLTGSFPLTIETPSAIALQVLNAVFYGLDLGELQTYRERVNAITPDDIQRVAREYLKPDRLRLSWSATRRSSRSSWQEPGSINSSAFRSPSWTSGPPT